MYWVDEWLTGFLRVLEILESPGILFWHFQSWKINAGPKKSWKSIDSCNKGFFKNDFLQYYFWISIS